MKLLWGRKSRLLPGGTAAAELWVFFEKMMNDLSIASGELGKWQTGTLLLKVVLGFHPAYVALEELETGLK